MRIRAWVWVGLLYLAALIITVSYGQSAFGHLADLGGSKFPQAAPALEFQEYRAFLRQAGLGLAAALGLWAAVTGLAARSHPVGAAALAMGVYATALALSLLPTLYVPGDSFQAWFFWMAEQFYVYTGVFVIVAIIGRRIRAT